MLKKLLAIKHVGRFVNCSAKGDVDFRKLNLIYSENGRGKSTLAAILRSLRTGQPELILERATLGSVDKPEVAILVEGGTATFKDAKWDNHVSHLEVFDSEFTTSNVYSGSYVDLEHKRNLFQFAVGEQGVKLAQEVAELTEAIREINTQITKQASAVQKCIIGKTMTVDVFINLKNEEMIDLKIEEKEKELSALQEASTIASKPHLSSLALEPPPIDKVRALIRRTLQDVSVAAVAVTKKHIAAHLDEHGEKWLSQGMVYLRGGDCPFCGRDTTGVQLVEFYVAFFKKEYGDLQEEIRNLAADIQRREAAKELLAIQKLLGANTALMEFWGRYLSITLPAFDFESLDTAYRQLCTQLAERLAVKARSPLESIEFGKEAEDAQQVFLRMLNLVSEYNEAVLRVNAQITEKKKTVAGGNAQAVRTELERLQNVKARYASEAIKVVNAYMTLLSDKKALEAKKNDTKTELDKLTDEILKKYQERINRHLMCFGVSFRITGNKRSYVGTAPSTTYQIEINGKPVALGDTKTPVGTPCFKTVLSDGDKSTLAFAFFLAKVEQDPAIAGKVIIFDDPISSLDGQRKACTQQAIMSVAGRAKQVMVLSHDELFLRDIYDHAASANCRTLHVVREAVEDSTIAVWDIKEATDSEYFRSYRRFKSYIDGSFKGDNRQIATSIRPFLEGHLRMRYPAAFGSHEWLGDFLNKIREAKAGDHLLALQPRLQEFSDINDYSKVFHHDQNPGAATHPVQDATLNAYVQRTLQVIGG